MDKLYSMEYIVTGHGTFSLVDLLKINTPDEDLSRHEISINDFSALELIHHKHDLYIGKNTYFNGKVLIKGISTTLIGKYCAFGYDVKLISVDHDYKMLNMQNKLQEKLQLRLSLASKGEICIGNANWVGDSAIVLSGVKTGPGVVIGAGSVVTKDIPPYCIVGGNPARIIAQRFSDERIHELLELAWWGWDAGKIVRNRSLFGTDISRLRGPLRDYVVN